MKPKVSVIIPTYKRADRIARAVESVIDQNYENFEIIVVDDNDPNSIDRMKTEQSLETYSNMENFKYIKHPKNLNGSAARNTGINSSEGEYITFLDDDDEYYTNKLSDQVECLEKLDDSWGMCYTSYEKIDQFGNFQKSNETSEGYVLVQALSKNLFMGSGSNFMVRRKVLEKIGLFNESFNRNQDLEFLARVAMKFKIKYVDIIGFLIHNEIRERKFTFEELMKINDSYREKFEVYFQNLNIHEQGIINEILDLMDIRAAIEFKKINYAFDIYNKKNIRIKSLIKYFTYLLHRIITKKSYGFKL